MEFKRLDQMVEFRRYTKTNHFLKLRVFPDGSARLLSGSDDIGVIIWDKKKNYGEFADIENPYKFFELIWTYFADGTERHVIPLIYSGFTPSDEEIREEMREAGIDV